MTNGLRPLIVQYQSQVVTSPTKKKKKKKKKKKSSCSRKGVFLLTSHQTFMIIEKPNVIAQKLRKTSVNNNGRLPESASSRYSHRYDISDPRFTTEHNGTSPHEKSTDVCEKETYSVIMDRIGKRAIMIALAVSIIATTLVVIITVVLLQNKAGKTEDSTEISPSAETETTERPSSGGYVNATADINACDDSSLDSSSGRDFIVGGKAEEDTLRYPWMMRIIAKQSVTSQLQSLCGGTLLDDLHVLTAAHCLPKVMNGAVGLALDEHELIIVQMGGVTTASFGHQEKVQAVFVHKGFNVELKQQRHDIAVLKLKNSLRFAHGWGTTIRPVCLPVLNERAPHDCEAIGWGLTDSRDTGSTSATLQRVELYVYHYPECLRFKPFDMSYASFFDDTNICAGAGSNVEGGRDICSGDSGGPLLCRTKNETKLKQFGIVSFGSSEAPCGSSGYVNYYVNVPAYVNWLRYVALPALEHVQQSKTELECLKVECMRLVQQRNDPFDMDDRTRDYICTLSATHVFCSRRDPVPDDCKKPIFPLFITIRIGPIPILYRGQALVLFIEDLSKSSSASCTQA
ncbi:CLIP domain-containing serine protease B4-like [Littorina saxatilis]|uniref:CLIP domain-containing serine protease B4-like n=1 Tax=Littorina saxatilis TaxID=31220 RepID=UPI0038B50663